MGSSSQSSRSGLQCGVLEVAEILWTDRDFGGLQKGEGIPGQLLDLGAGAGMGTHTCVRASYLLVGWSAWAETWRERIVPSLYQKCSWQWFCKREDRGDH